MGFSDLKKKSSSALSSLTEKVKGLSNKQSKKFEKDSRFWELEVDEAGNGGAVIRFLPGAEGEDDLVFARYFKHAFKGPTGKWYIEKSLTSLNEKDPVAEANKVLWDSNIKANRDIVSTQRKRKERFISNILVIKDPANPDNEGKVFLYDYPKAIFKLIQAQIDPTDPNAAIDPLADEADEFVPVNVFDFWQGANFKLRVRSLNNFPNYDKSSFADPSALFDGDDAKLEGVYKQLHKLSDFLKPENFKTYDQLKDRLDAVLNSGAEANVENVKVKAVAPKAAASVFDDADEDASVLLSAVEDDGDDLLSKLDQIADEG